MPALLLAPHSAGPLPGRAVSVAVQAGHNGLVAAPRGSAGGGGAGVGGRGARPRCKWRQSQRPHDGLRRLKRRGPWAAPPQPVAGADWKVRPAAFAQWSRLRRHVKGRLQPLCRAAAPASSPRRAHRVGSEQRSEQGGVEEQRGASPQVGRLPGRCGGPAAPARQPPGAVLLFRGVPGRSGRHQSIELV